MSLKQNLQLEHLGSVQCLGQRLSSRKRENEFSPQIHWMFRINSFKITFRLLSSIGLPDPGGVDVTFRESVCGCMNGLLFAPASIRVVQATASQIPWWQMSSAQRTDAVTDIINNDTSREPVRLSIIHHVYNLYCSRISNKLWAIINYKRCHSSAKMTYLSAYLNAFFTQS